MGRPRKRLTDEKSVRISADLDRRFIDQLDALANRLNDHRSGGPG